MEERGKAEVVRGARCARWRGVQGLERVKIIGKSEDGKAGYH